MNNETTTVCKAVDTNALSNKKADMCRSLAKREYSSDHEASGMAKQIRAMEVLMNIMHMDEAGVYDEGHAEAALANHVHHGSSDDILM